MDLKLNWWLIIYATGIISFIVTTALLITVGIAVIYSDETDAFTRSALLTGTAGLLFYIIAGKHRYEGIQRKEAIFIVALSWLYISLTGCLPFYFSGTFGSFTDAFFESVSGFTTTGASILTDIEVMPRSILFWRSFTHWIGGIGIIVLFIVVMPSLHEGGNQLFGFESSFHEKIKPRIKSVGQQLAYIYVALTVLQTLLLLAGGMNFFESICHSFGTVASRVGICKHTGSW